MFSLYLESKFWNTNIPLISKVENLDEKKKFVRKNPIATVLNGRYSSWNDRETR